MRILLFDTNAYYPSSPLFLDALQELCAESGHQYEFVDEAQFAASRSLVSRVFNQMLARPPVHYRALNEALLDRALTFQPDLVIICKGAYVSPATLASIATEMKAFLVNYATDDPFNTRVNTDDLVRSIPVYDLYASTKQAIIPDLERAGCKRAIYVPFGYKPSQHFAERALQSGVAFESDVVFIGGCDSDRIPYFETLVRSIPGIRLALYGGYWNASPLLRKYWYGVAMGRDFRLALSETRIALNLVRRANRDGHVMRTFEIPACGAFMLAERTDEHLKLFEENREAAYFGSPEELVEKVRYYLKYEDQRHLIAAAGHRKVQTGRNTYKDRLIQIIESVEHVD
ncbi:MAG: glycosyltransferase [Candidatus Binataceae bacterium]